MLKLSMARSLTLDEQLEIAGQGDRSMQSRMCPLLVSQAPAQGICQAQKVALVRSEHGV